MSISEKLMRSKELSERFTGIRLFDKFNEPLMVRTWTAYNYAVLFQEISSSWKKQLSDLLLQLKGLPGDNDYFTFLTLNP